MVQNAEKYNKEPAEMILREQILAGQKKVKLTSEYHKKTKQKKGNGPSKPWSHSNCKSVMLLVNCEHKHHPTNLNKQIWV